MQFMQSPQPWESTRPSKRHLMQLDSIVDVMKGENAGTSCSLLENNPMIASLRMNIKSSQRFSQKKGTSSLWKYKNVSERSLIAFTEREQR